MASNTNALEELKHSLDGAQKKIEDIDYGYIIYTPNYRESNLILDTQGSITLVDVSKLNFEYDSGYGSQEVYGTIVFKDGSWLERGEYDGSEWWDYKSCPSRAYVEKHKKSHLKID